MASGDALDDDFVRAALLFLDDLNGETETDSSSTPKPSSLQEHELVDHATNAELACFEDSVDVLKRPRPAKKPRTSATAGVLKLAPKGSPVVPKELLTQLAMARKAFCPTAPRRVDKRKEEIKMLRDQAESLQAHLDMLHRQLLESEDLQSVSGVEAWQAIANQQLEQRKLAETENRRLKELASETRRAAKALRRIAARQIKTKIWEPLRPTPVPPRHAFDPSRTLADSGIYAMLRSSLDEMQFQTDAILFDATSRALHTERHEGSHLVVKLQDSRMMPFGVATTASAVWNYTFLNEAGKQHQWSVAGDGSFYCEFTALAELDNVREHCNGKLVVRRVEESNRTIIVCHSVVNCLTGGQQNLYLTKPIRHYLWTVIDRPPLFVTPSERDIVSRVRTCAMFMPCLNVGDLNDPTREAAIKEAVVLCSQVAIQQCEHSYDIVDNILLQGTGGQRAAYRAPFQESWAACVC